MVILLGKIRIVRADLQLCHWLSRVCILRINHRSVAHDRQKKGLFLSMPGVATPCLLRRRDFGATPVVERIGIVNLYYGAIDLFILRAVNEFYLSWPKADVRKENRLVVCSDEELNFGSGVFRAFRIVIICADFMPGSETVVWNKHILFCGIRVYDTVFPRCNQERDLTGLLSTPGNRGCDRICRDRRAKYQLVHMHVGIFGWVERKRQFPQMVPQSVLIELLGKNSLYWDGRFRYVYQMPCSAAGAG